jgi:hypothetical protein
MGVFNIIEHVSPRNLNRQRSVDHCPKNVGIPRAVSALDAPGKMIPHSEAIRARRT